jgi:hypothetical protein
MMELAKQALTKEGTDTIDTSIPPAMQQRGMKLASASQAQLYKGIQCLQKTTPRPKASINLAHARISINELSQRTPEDYEIWKAIRDPSIN